MTEETGVAGGMGSGQRTGRWVWVAIAGLVLTGLAGCHSYHVETTVQNRTGGPIKLLEVDYPSASFGDGTLEAGADYHYRIQLQGSGPLKVQYTDAGGHQPVITGPTLTERQEGSW